VQFKEQKNIWHFKNLLLFLGKQTFEKMISGMYMGELTRQVKRFQNFQLFFCFHYCQNEQCQNNLLFITVVMSFESPNMAEKPEIYKSPS